jgi:signal transduction histidine kinase
MKIRTRLIVGTVAAVTIAAVIGVVLYSVNRDVDKDLRKLNNANRVVRGMFELSLLRTDYVLHREQMTAEQWLSKATSVEKELKSIVAGNKEERDLLAGVKRNYIDIDRLIEKLVSGYGLQGAPGDPPAGTSALEERLVSQFLVKTQSVVTDTSRLAALAQADVVSAESMMYWLVIAFVSAMILVMAAMYVMIGLSVIRPINELEKGTELVASGDFDVAIDVGTKDEIGHLAGAFNRMTAELQRSYTELEAEIEERKRTELELEAYNRELESFSYSVSHDLRAPLRSIDGFSQAAIEDYGDLLGEEGKGFLQRVRAASQDMGRTIDDLLKLSRVTREEMRLDDVDLSGIAREVADGLARTQPERKVEFEIEPGLEVRGDRALLRVMMENLLDNAWKFTSNSETTRIELGAAEVEGEKAFYVRDNGVGFDMSYADKLFTPFQRLHDKTEFPGTGIGLATAQRVIRRHGGSIWAEGKVGEGATFYFKL